MLTDMMAHGNRLMVICVKQYSIIKACAGNIEKGSQICEKIVWCSCQQKTLLLLQKGCK